MKFHVGSDYISTATSLNDISVAEPAIHLIARVVNISKNNIRMSIIETNSSYYNDYLKNNKSLLFDKTNWRLAKSEDYRKEFTPRNIWVELEDKLSLLS